MPKQDENEESLEGNIDFDNFFKSKWVKWSDLWGFDLVNQYQFLCLNGVLGLVCNAKNVEFPKTVKLYGAGYWLIYVEVEELVLQ